MNELVKLVEEWAKEKRLDKAEPEKQMLKVIEEVGEVALHWQETTKTT